MGLLRSVTGTIAAGIVLTVLIGLADGPALDVSALILWAHVVASIVWIGMLYYFDFVQTPALAAAAADRHGPGGAGIAKYAAPRALAWFRWGALAAWLTGAGVLLRYGWLDDAFMLAGDAGAPENIRVIGIGAWLGTLMLLNVWTLIWPSQKKLLGLVEASAAEIDRARRIAFFASRTNTVLSLPLLACMVGFGRTGFFI